MKKVLLTAILVLGVVCSYGQVQKYRCYKDMALYNGNSSINQPWTYVDILITLDAEAQRLHVYSNKEIVIDILSTKSPYKDNYGKLNFDFSGIDDEGIRCKCSMVYNGSDVTLFIVYNDLILIYKTIVI